MIPEDHFCRKSFQGTQLKFLLLRQTRHSLDSLMPKNNLLERSEADYVMAEDVDHPDIIRYPEYRELRELE